MVWVRACSQVIPCGGTRGTGRNFSLSTSVSPVCLFPPALYNLASVDVWQRWTRHWPLTLRKVGKDLPSEAISRPRRTKSDNIIRSIPQLLSYGQAGECWEPSNKTMLFQISDIIGQNSAFNFLSSFRVILYMPLTVWLGQPVFSVFVNWFFTGAFAELRKAIASFAVSVRPSVPLCACLSGYLSV